jgi:hypothetical protein
VSFVLALIKPPAEFNLDHTNEIEEWRSRLCNRSQVYEKIQFSCKKD